MVVFDSLKLVHLPSLAVKNLTIRPHDKITIK